MNASARLKDGVSSAVQLHGWNAPAGVNVGVQLNIPMPTPEERAEMRALDAKLDAIAAKLRWPSPTGGRGSRLRRARIARVAFTREICAEKSICFANALCFALRLVLLRAKMAL